MIRLLARAGAIALVLLASSSLARAQDVVTDLAARVGKNVDLRTEPALRARLVEAGLVSRTAAQVHVDSALLERAVALRRFTNHVNVTRYHAGDRILVEDPGSGGKYSPRAEIAEVLPDGRYRVKVWNKPESVTSPTLSGHVDALTGEPPSSAPTTKVRVHRADGTVVEETHRAPWLIRDREREVVLTHADVEKLNGPVHARGPYSVNGWAIDPVTDPVLAERIKKARAAAEEMFPADKLALPEDPAARKAKLEEIAKLQEKFLNRVFADNFIEHPGNNPAAYDRMRDVLAARPELNGKIGAVLESKCGVCTDQAAAMAAILNAVGDRAGGLTARTIGGPTIAENAGHGFVFLRLAGGKVGMYDVTWHFEGERHSVDNMDFATFDGRRDSNRRIDYVEQETTDATAFVDPTSERARELERGYGHAEGEALLAARAAERAAKDRVAVDEATRRVLAENDGKGRVAGNFDAAKVADRARTMKPAPTAGILGGLDRVRDRDRARARPGR